MSLPLKIKTTVCIVVHNNLAITKRCLDLLFRHTKDFKLIIFDNGSTDGTQDYLMAIQEHYRDKVLVVLNVCNEGFIKPNNEGFVLSDTPYFLTLNNDVRVCAGWLEAMEQVLDTEPNIGLVGVDGTCCALGPDGSAQYAPHDVQYVEASCMLVRSSALFREDLFDRKMRFGYFEDTDLGYRMRSQGVGLRLVPNGVEHDRGLTARQVEALGTADIKGAWLHNRNVFYRKWGAYLPVSGPENQILVKRAGAIGDVILTTPVIRAIKHRWPNSSILYSTHCDQPLVNNPHISEVLTADKNLKYARVIDFDKLYERKPNQHVIDCYAEEAGVQIMDYKPDLYPSKIEQDVLERWLDERMTIHSRGVCVIHPGLVTGWIGRQWAPERFDELAKVLMARGYYVALTGNQGTPLISCHADFRNRKFEFTMALIQQCSLFVGIDSAPFHVAQAFERPAAVLFGSVSPDNLVLPRSRSTIVVSDKWLGCLGCHNSLPAPRTCTTECMRGAFGQYQEPCMDMVKVDHFMEAIQRAEAIETVRRSTR